MAMMTTIEKILAKAATLEAQAGALRLAATILNGDLRAHKHKTVGALMEAAIVARRAQHTNGGPPAGEDAAEAPRKGQRGKRGKESYAAMQARRQAKRDVILAILREYGKPMPIALLAAAAKKRGLGALTGISGSVRSKQLKKTGTRGNTRYSVGPG